ncbi:MAG TPA: pitrilysin family protein [Vicinamibacterales bacterium]|nr:pitrilysin family protein [Vicinamibacterales bacterium]
MSRRLAVIALMLLAVPLDAQSPAPAAPPSIQVPFRQFQLPNGLNVILHQDKTVPVVAVNVWYHVGSANEKPGRTGFAHLFEHLMFEGSKNVPEGQFDILLEAAGANNNGSTNNDRTNYVIDLPSNALELALFLESDRMAYLLDAMPPEQVNSQRDVVKNERRQSYENRPYGMASLELDKMLWPANHPYSWPVIGHMEDLTAATQADVQEFFKKYYAPNNASLVIAGDIDLDRTQGLVQKWFSEIPRGPAVEPVAPPAAVLTGVKRQTLTDQVSLPRLYLGWLTPRLFAPGDATLDLVSSVLSDGKNSRLYKRLVYDDQIAQDVSAFQSSGALGSSFLIVATARRGHTAEELQKAIDEEIDKLRRAPPEAREVQRALNQVEASFYRAMERVGGFGGKADQLNAYYFAGGGPDFFAEDLARYTSLTPADVQAAVVRWLPRDRRIELVVLPEEKK